METFQDSDHGTTPARLPGHGFFLMIGTNHGLTGDGRVPGVVDVADISCTVSI